MPEHPDTMKSPFANSRPSSVKFFPKSLCVLQKSNLGFSIMDDDP